MEATNQRKALFSAVVATVALCCSLFVPQAWAGEGLTAGSAAAPGTGAQPLQAQATAKDYSFRPDSEGNPTIMVRGVTSGAPVYDANTRTLSLVGIKMKGIYLNGCEKLTINVGGPNAGSDVFVRDEGFRQGSPECDITITGSGTAVGRIDCGGNLAINSGFIEAKGIDEVDSEGIVYRDGICCSGNVTINGGTVKASCAGHAEETGGSAIFAEGDIVVKGNAAVSLTAKRNGEGIAGFGKLTVGGNASLDIATENASGIHVSSMLVNGGAVSTTADGEDNRAIETDGDMTIEKGEVVATSTSNFEVVCVSGSLTQSGGTLKVLAKSRNTDELADGLAVRCDATLKVNGGTFIAKTVDAENAFAVLAGEATFSDACKKQIAGGIYAKNFLIESHGNTYKVNWYGDAPFAGVMLTLVKHEKGAAMPKAPTTYELVNGYPLLGEIKINGYLYMLTAVKAKASIAEASTTVASAAYTGKALKPEVKVTHAGNVLTEGVEYTVKYKNNVKAGTGKAIVTGKGSGFFTGKKTVKFKIAKASIAKAKFAKVKTQKLKKKGKAVKPAVTVKFAGKKLKAGRDYTLTYRNNAKKGTAKVIVKGKGNFKGQKTLKFKIA